MRSGATLSRCSSALLVLLAVLPARAENGPDRCKLLARALDVVGHERRRFDLAQPKDGVPPCQRPDIEGCVYVVQVRHELTAAGRQDLSDEVGSRFATGDCREDMEFAKKHGLAAYLDHKTIVERTVDEIARFCCPR